ncbi:MAG TPA: hypothetical protein VMT63_05720 [Bacteroidales bacterium]|nr:hypothetical protein [Bacteroidales bacterium]
MKNTDKDGKPTPRVEKSTDKDGRPIHREYSVLDDTGFFAGFDEEKFGETISKIILHDVPDRHLPYLKKHLEITAKSTEIAEPEFTVKSILLAYYYMKEKKIFPIPALSDPEFKKTDFYKALAARHGHSYNSYKNDWQPLKDDAKRLGNPESIKLAIVLLKRFQHQGITKAIELAEGELSKAELKSQSLK